MATETVCEWSIDGVLNEIANIHSKMKDRQYAFILGSGASFKSGIPTGYQLAKQWIEDLYLRECLDGTPLEKWMVTCGVGDGKLTLNSVAEFYPQIFERRFHGDREAGYAELEAAMEGVLPSLGYSLLAEIIQKTRNKVVVTTNFDNLVADALAMHAHQSPLVVAHESLAGFVRPQLRRPLVAKIHRDLFLQPFNDVDGVSKMEAAWTSALKKLFQHFTPIVVGYGGNDGSLMNMLEGLNEGDISGRIIWCCRDVSKLPEKVLSVLHKHNGVVVRIEGFDEFMLQLAAKLIEGFDVTEIAERTAKLGEERADRYREQTAELQGVLVRGTPEKQKVGAVMKKSVEAGKNWWAWELKAQSATDLQVRDQIYREGLGHFPKSVPLTTNYAIFLKNHIKNYDAAEVMYKRALELDPSHAGNISNYANFLSNQRKDYNAAEAMYKRALEKDPMHARSIGNYAGFLAKQRQDYDTAEAMYKRALELDPSDAGRTGSYAIFLADQRKDYDAAEAMYKRALELDPSDAGNTGNYANFLAEQRQDYDAAEAMHKRAQELDPSDAVITGNYANFLSEQRQDYDAAEAMYKRALELDPSDAFSTGNYALLLNKQRKDDDAAEAMYKRALELDPSHTGNIGNYANFLAEQRQDYDAAEAMYKRALELDPSNAVITGNYASFLADQRQDYDTAEAMYKRALELDPSNAGNTGNYAHFLAGQRQDYDTAEAMYKRALELDPSHAGSTGNYAHFLVEQRQDYDAAEAMYKRALELTSNDENNCANYASLLMTKGDEESLNAVPALVQQVMQLSKSEVTQSLAESLFYGTLVQRIKPDVQPTNMLARLKGALNKDYPRGTWDFTRMFETMLPRFSKNDQAFFMALGQAILDKEKVSKLESFEAWREIKPIDPFAE